MFNHSISIFVSLNFLEITGCRWTHAAKFTLFKTDCLLSVYFSLSDFLTALQPNQRFARAYNCSTGRDAEHGAFPCFCFYFPPTTFTTTGASLPAADPHLSVTLVSDHLIADLTQPECKFPLLQTAPTWPRPSPHPAMSNADLSDG